MIKPISKIEPLLEELTNIVPSEYLISHDFKKACIKEELDEIWLRYKNAAEKMCNYFALGDNMERIYASDALTMLCNDLFSKNIDLLFSFVKFLISNYYRFSREKFSVKELKECLELIGIEDSKLCQLDEFDNFESEGNAIDENPDKSDVEKIRELEEKYKQLSDNEPNSKQSIEAYHKWYNETLLYLSKTCKKNEDFSKFKNLDNSGNGHCLRDNYHQISGIYNLLLAQNSSKQSSDKMERSKVNNKVFIVHGHDNAMKSVVARFIEHLKLVPIILDEEPNKGQTIIEKIESNSDVGYAIVLLSPCDVGRSKDSEELRPRARQNVIMELGYFIGKLGRSNVCALKKNDIEIPSDALGVLYTSYSDNDEGWKMHVARELKSSGYDIDMNLLCSE